MLSVFRTLTFSCKTRQRQRLELVAGYQLLEHLFCLKAPNSLLDALEQHYAALDGKKAPAANKYVVRFAGLLQ